MVKSFTDPERYKRFRKQSDIYLQQIGEILCKSMNLKPEYSTFHVASFEEDTKHCCDLVVDVYPHLRIACRTRSIIYKERFPYDFTIRSYTGDGIKSELDKILEGYGDYLFYSFVDGQRIVSWVLLDLNVFREWYKYQNNPGDELTNEEGTKLRAFRWDLIEDIVIKRSK